MDNIELKHEDVNFVIYHADCFDGFCSALAAYLCNENVTFYPAKYKTEPPYDELVGKNVLICDFSYKYEQILKIMDFANKFVIIDHHKTSEIELKNILPSNKYFDMAHCGAYLTWK